jgi:hypothetical protein
MHERGSSESHCALLKGVDSDVHEHIYTGLNPFNFIPKHFLQICLCLRAQQLSKHVVEMFVALKAASCEDPGIEEEEAVSCTS